MTVVWTQWGDLELPSGVKQLATNGTLPAENDLAQIEFFVPKYMSGMAGVSSVPQMKKLQVLHSLMAGVDELIPIVPKNVTLCNATGVHDASTAELAVALAIAARRGWSYFQKNQAMEVWDHQRFASLADSKVAIVGYGNIGQRIEKLLTSFEVDITAFSKSGRAGSLPIISFDSMIASFDVIILIAPLTAESRNLMNQGRLQGMKDGACLINVSRGQLIDTDALAAELETGRIFAGLDVTDPEPLPPGHRLWRAPNLIITPHIGGDSQAFERRGRELVQAQIHRFVAGQPLLNIVVTGLVN